MPEQTLPITYRRHVRRASYMTKVERLLDLRKTGEHTRTQRFPSTAPALQKFARNFLPKEVYAYVKQRRGLGLTVRARRRLAKPVEITTYEYSGAGGLRVVIELAAKNEIPVMCVELWLRRRMPVLGGFISITAV